MKNDLNEFTIGPTREADIGEFTIPIELTVVDQDIESVLLGYSVWEYIPLDDTWDIPYMVWEYVPTTESWNISPPVYEYQEVHFEELADKQVFEYQEVETSI